MRGRREKVEIIGDEEQIVSFRLGKGSFGINVNQVREIGKVRDITRIPQVPDYIEGVINLRGQITTVIDLRKRFAIPPEEGRKTDRARMIVAEIGDHRLGLMVDEVEDVLRVSRQSISGPPPALAAGHPMNGLSGICRLPDRLIVMVNVRQLMGERDPPKATGPEARTASTVCTEV